MNKIMKYLPFHEFKRNPENLRSDFKDHAKDLIESIKSENKVFDPIWILPDHTIIEGNTRHYCLEILSKDPEYKGSLDLPYYILEDEDLINSKYKQIAFSLNLNSIDKRLNPKDIWKGIDKIISDLESKYQHLENPRLEAAKECSLLLNKSFAWILLYKRVFENQQASFLIEYLGNMIPSIAYADKIIAKANNLDISIEEFLKECLDVIFEKNKNKITPKYIEEAYQRILSRKENQLNLDKKESKEKKLDISEEEKESYLDLILDFSDFLYRIDSKSWEKIKSSDKFIWISKSIKKIYDILNSEISDIIE